MTRGKRKPKEESSLLTALKFVASAQRAIGAIEQTHCIMVAGWVMASNSILSAAHALTEDIQACPHTLTLVEALERAPGPVNLTMLDANRLSVRAGEFQAVIPCQDRAALPVPNPDVPVALCDERLRAALTCAGTLAVEGADKVINASVQMRNQSVIASNGTTILEAWHGIEMPPLQIVPKTFITAINKTKKNLTRFGCSPDSFTVWFEDGNWLKTQCYANTTELPDLDKFLNVPTNPVAVPKGMFETIKRLEPFSEDGQVHFTPDGLRVSSGMTFATDNCKGLPSGISFSIKNMLLIAPYAKTIHFNVANGITIFFGENVRGAIVNQVG